MIIFIKKNIFADGNGNDEVSLQLVRRISFCFGFSRCFDSALSSNEKLLETKEPLKKILSSRKINNNECKCDQCDHCLK